MDLFFVALDALILGSGCSVRSRQKARARVDRSLPDQQRKRKAEEPGQSRDSGRAPLEQGEGTSSMSDMLGHLLQEKTLAQVGTR